MSHIDTSPSTDEFEDARVSEENPTGGPQSPDVPSTVGDPGDRVGLVRTTEATPKQSLLAGASMGRGGDIGFMSASIVSSTVIVLVVVFVGIFLLALAVPSLRANNSSFLFSNDWNMAAEGFGFGILGLLWTTVITSIIAMVIAVPVAIGIALLISQYVQPRIGKTIGFVVDLLAAVPSVIFGLWGITTFAPALRPISEFLQTYLGWIPLFSPNLPVPDGSAFTAGVVLAMMILPIVTSISRDVFAQTPRDEVEAALALGATKWETIRLAVLPYGRSGVIAAAMLGLGRALGETIAVMIILSKPPTAPMTMDSLSVFAGGETFASTIAANAGEFDSALKTGAFIAAGLVLFIVTFVVNAAARIIAERGKAKA